MNASSIQLNTVIQSSKEIFKAMNLEVIKERRVVPTSPCQAHRTGGTYEWDRRRPGKESIWEGREESVRKGLVASRVRCRWVLHWNRGSRCSSELSVKADSVFCWRKVRGHLLSICCGRVGSIGYTTKPFLPTLLTKPFSPSSNVV